MEIISLCFQADLQDQQQHHHHPLTFAAARRGASIVAWALKTREPVTNNNNKRWICTVASPPMSDVETSQESEESLVENAEARDSFVWKSNWYPVCPEIDMDKTVPHGFQILGRKVVIWYDKQLSKWQTFVDMCPHRLAPLSEGRIDEQGCLQCCYHGWSFNGDGSCARIPQAQPEGPEAKAAGNKMAHCISFPTVVKQGILFIWPDEYGQELADKTLPPITPGIDEPGWCAVATFRDVDYGFDTAMENLVDPSHIPVAHHNVNGGILGKRDNAAPIALELKSMNARGFVGEWKKPWGGTSEHTYEAPSRFTYMFPLKGIKGASGCTTTYATPMSPGKARIIVVNARNALLALSSGPHWWQLFPRWLDHQMILNLLDGDLALLHFQEQNMTQVTGGSPDKWSKAVFIPAAADRYVAGFRQWLNRYGGKMVQWTAGVNPSLPPRITKKEDLLDRYNKHTEKCVACRNALKNFKFARTTFYILAAVLTGVAVLLPQSPSRYAAVGVAAVCALLAWRLVDWIQMFTYKGWDHARLP